MPTLYCPLCEEDHSCTEDQHTLYGLVGDGMRVCDPCFRWLADVVRIKDELDGVNRLASDYRMAKARRIDG